MVELHPRECLVRVSANGQIVPVFKARTLDIGTGETQTKIKVDELKEAKSETLAKSKPKKFVENSSDSSTSNAVVPSFVSSEQAAILNEVNLSIPEPANPAELSIPIEDSAKDAKDGSLQFGSPMNPEAELSPMNNPEIDPEERRQMKQEHAKKASGMGQLIAKNDVELEPATITAPVTNSSQPDVAAPTSGIESADSGFGSGNLASILASQSSNNEVTTKKRG